MWTRPDRVFFFYIYIYIYIYMPSRTYTAKEERSMPGFILPKDRAD